MSDLENVFFELMELPKQLLDKWQKGIKKDPHYKP